MCDTINNSWGYNKNDDSYKSTKQIVQLLVKSAGYDGNLLLNVGRGRTERSSPSS